MAEFEMKCPHCQTVFQMRDEWVGMETECPSCKQTFTIRKRQQVRPALVNRNQYDPQGQPQYGQGQYGPPGQGPYGQPQYGQQPGGGQYGQQYDFRGNGFQQMNYGIPPQGAGAQFQLMPGEFKFYSGNIMHCKIPAVMTTMYLTNQRICFCDIPFVLTFLFWIFWFIPFSKISLSLNRNDISEMHMEPIFGRKKVVITCVNGQTFGFASCWFSNTPVNAIMQWFHNPGM